MYSAEDFIGVGGVRFNSYNVFVLVWLLGEYERVQKKAFTNWVNSHLIKVCN